MLAILVDVNVLVLYHALKYLALPFYPHSELKWRAIYAHIQIYTYTIWLTGFVR